MQFHSFFSLFVILTSSCCVATEPQADFYVSTEGSDSWSGRLSVPNLQRSDGPFATLERARNAIRESRAARTGDAVVLIRGGTYQLARTVVFGLQDSGAGESTVTYAAWPCETPVFSSGRAIEDWRTVTTSLAGLPKAAIGKLMVADIPVGKSGDVSSEAEIADLQVLTLFDEEGILPRARSKGFIPRKDGSRNELHFPMGRIKNWSNLKDVEIVVRPHHAWIVNILPLLSVDEDRMVARTSVNATYAMNPLHFLKTTPSCWVENVLEELNEPGEWVVNRQEGKIYLWPRNQSTVLVPQLTELIRVEGDVDKKGPEDTPVRNLCFRGLSFTHGERGRLSNDDAGLQHDWEMHDKANAMVRLRGAEDCVIDGCHFSHCGGSALRVDLHGQNNTISGNTIEHVGGVGILLCGYGPGTKDVNGKNVVYNNHIHHVGRIYSHSPGVMVWQSGGNRIANNLIHHTPYTGIIISGCMTDFFTKNGRELGRTIRRHEIKGLPKKPKLTDVRRYLHTRDNAIEFNEIHHVMERLGDGNGIYVRGAGANNVIRGNYIHHLVTPMKMQCAIRTDGGQTDTLIIGNLIYKCMAQGIILKLNNRCENNIIADIIAPPRGYYLAVREGPMRGATIQRNIFYSPTPHCTFIDELPAGKGRVSEDRRGRELASASQADTDRNIYFCASDLKLGNEMLAKQRHQGVDVNSLAVDPLFVDPAKGDFRLQPDSPAFRLGVVPFEVSKAGLVKDDADNHKK